MSGTKKSVIILLFFHILILSLCVFLEGLWFIQFYVCFYWDLIILFDICFNHFNRYYSIYNKIYYQKEIK